MSVVYQIVIVRDLYLSLVLGSKLNIHFIIIHLFRDH